MELSCKPQVQNMDRTWAEHVLPMFCACCFHGNSMNNLLSYCGLIDAKIRDSDKDLPVRHISGDSKKTWALPAFLAVFDSALKKP